MRAVTPEAVVDLPPSEWSKISVILDHSEGGRSRVGAVSRLRYPLVGSDFWASMGVTRAGRSGCAKRNGPLGPNLPIGRSGSLRCATRRLPALAWLGFWGRRPARHNHLTGIGMPRQACRQPSLADTPSFNTRVHRRAASPHVGRPAGLRTRASLQWATSLGLLCRHRPVQHIGNRVRRNHGRLCGKVGVARRGLHLCMAQQFPDDGQRVSGRDRS